MSRHVGQVAAVNSAAKVYVAADGVVLAGQSSTSHDYTYDAADDCLVTRPGSTGTGDLNVVATVNTISVILDRTKVIPVSTAVVAQTITVATATTRSGAILEVVDVGGAAATRNITVTLGSAHFEDGTTSKTISTNYGRLAFVYDVANAPNAMISTETP